MDLLIVVVILYLVSRWIFAKVKQDIASQFGKQRKETHQESIGKFGPFAESEKQEPPILSRWAHSEEGESAEGWTKPGTVRLEPRVEGYEGSLGFSQEGVDICDPSLQHDRIILSDAFDLPQNSNEENQASLFFTEDAVIQGVVMAEVLARPWERKWGKR